MRTPGRAKYVVCFPLVLSLFLFGCSKYRLTAPLGSSAELWPQLYKNAARNGCDTVACAFPLHLQWQKRASSAVGPAMIGFNGTVLFGTLDGSLEGFRLSEGKSIGKINIRSKVPVTCAYRAPYLIVLRRTGSNNLICYDLQQAKTVWSAGVGMVLGEPLVHASQIFVATADGRILRLRSPDGQISNHTRLRARFIASPALSEEVLVVGDDQGVVRAFDLTLEPLWQFDTGSSIRAAPVIDGGQIFIGSTDGNFYCLDLLTGTVIWKTPTGGNIFHTAAACEDRVVFGATDHTVYCLDRRTGESIWTFKSQSVIGTAPVVTQNTAFIGSLDKTLYALDLQSGAKQWDFTAKGRIRSNPIIVDNYLLVAAENDYLYCFRLNSW